MPADTPRRALALSTPSVALGVIAWLAYTAVTVGVQASADIPYDQWFTTAANAWRVGVASLVAGALLLIVLVAATRWNHLWRDPVRLPVSPLMKFAIAAWWTAIVLRLLGVRWREVPLDLLAAMATAGVLVGFAEELLFRGFFLRGLREGGRPESSAAVWTAVAFGVFHLPNIVMGTGLVGLLQVVLAAASGAVLYAMRRQAGVLWPAMVAHGAWDVSVFLSGGYAQPWATLASLVLQVMVTLLGLVILVGLYRNDRTTVPLPATR